MKTLKLLTVIRQDIDPLSRAVWKSKVLYSACYEEGAKEEAFIVVDKNRIIFNDSAFESVGGRAGDRFDVVYKQLDTVLAPCLVNKTAINQEGGKILRKNHTISFTGTAHEELVKYGMFFRFLPYDNEYTTFVLVPAENINRNGIIGATVEDGSDFDLDKEPTDQTEYNNEFIVDDRKKEYTKEEDLDDIINTMFN